VLFKFIGFGMAFGEFREFWFRGFEKILGDLGMKGFEGI
jgi:hypothetical protein